MLQLYLFGNSGPHAKFKNRSLAHSRLFGSSGKILLKVKATLGSAEVSAGAVALKFQLGLWLRLTNSSCRL